MVECPGRALTPSPPSGLFPFVSVGHMHAVRADSAQEAEFFLSRSYVVNGVRPRRPPLTI